MRILFIGNSYTGQNDLHGMIRELAASAPVPRVAETRALLMSGMPLRAHWNKGEAVQWMEKERWDFVVLQEQSTLPVKNPARMHDSVRLFNEAIRKHGARPVLYMTWARQDAPEKQKDIADAYLSIGREIDALVAPAGLAWERVLREHPEITLHKEDRSHPTLAGSYLAACTLYATLFGETPVGLWFPDGLPTEQVQVIQTAAWDAVREMVSQS